MRVKQFVSLEWKQFFRSANFGKSIAIKIFMGFMALYMIGAFLFIGVFLYKILKKLVPDLDPIEVINNYLIYWILIELVIRYFMQKLPVLNIKPLLTLAISRHKITNYVLTKSALSFFNVMSLFWIIPFCITLLIKGYPVINVLPWFVSLVCIVLIINFLNFLINKKNVYFYSILGVLILAIGLEYYNIFEISAVCGKAFNVLYNNPILTIVPIIILALVYYLNYKNLRGLLFLDASLKQKTEEAKTQDLTWTNRFGDIAPFLQLDLKLIWRNKRPRMTVFLSILFLLYGLYFYTNDKMLEMPVILVFAGIFITGMFLSNFGQFIPSWDSSYYSMMMSQNIPLRKYLDSKAGLITFSVVVLFLLSIPYVYFGWEVLVINFACALYNIGINMPMVLLISSMNKKRIDLEKSPMMNTQGMSAAQWIIIFPFLGLPVVIYLIPYLLSNAIIASIVLGSVGVIGILFRNLILNKITEIYRSKKYAMVAGFKEQN
ncbi:DUF5687 family protein [Psychroserpens sp. AS72]|uniref:DUF5687 family protein n=1 Tax=Psychroserpens sp. AS72 TaxID=3135775 RepID=UPI00316EAF7C